MLRGETGSGDNVLRLVFNPGRLVTAILLAILCAAPLAAQDRSHSVPRPPQNQPPRAAVPQYRPPAPGHHSGQWLLQHRSLSPQEQQRALQSDPQFRRLPAERQQRLQDRLQRFNNMPPEQQQRVLNRMETWEHLTPGQKQQARGVFSEMRNLPPDRRQMVQTAIRDLRAMPPEQRQRIIESDRFRERFSPQERGLLNDATHLPLAPAEPPQAVPRPPSR
jgi:hypothetical protein